MKQEVEKVRTGNAEFPTLTQTGQSTTKKLMLLDETETSRNQSSEAPKERELELCLPNLTELDQLILKKLRTTFENYNSILG